MEKICFLLKEPKRKKFAVHSFDQETDVPEKTAATSYEGYLIGDCVILDSADNVVDLYKLGFFGKGHLSWSAPEYNETRNHCLNRNKQHAKTIDRRRFLTHCRWTMQREGENETCAHLFDQLPYSKKRPAESSHGLSAFLQPGETQLTVCEVGDSALSCANSDAESQQDAAFAKTGQPEHCDPWQFCTQARIDNFWTVAKKVVSETRLDRVCCSVVNSKCEKTPQQVDLALTNNHRIVDQESALDMDHSDCSGVNWRVVPTKDVLDAIFGKRNLSQKTEFDGSENSNLCLDFIGPEDNSKCEQTPQQVDHTITTEPIVEQESGCMDYEVEVMHLPSQPGYEKSALNMGHYDCRGVSCGFLPGNAFVYERSLSQKTAFDESENIPGGIQNLCFNEKTGVIGDKETETCCVRQCWNLIGSKEETGDDCDAVVSVVDDTEDSDVDESLKPPWQTVQTKDPYPLIEHLILSLEEAFYLSYGFGCLVVYDSEKKAMNLTEMWQSFCRARSNFVSRYVVYHNFRSKGWVPKCGLKFGVDFLLYKQGPSFYHATYSVVVKTLGPSDEVFPSWVALSSLNRITEQVSKELMVCYVLQPKDVTENDLSTPSIISQFKIMQHIVDILVELQKQVEVNNGILHTKAEENLVDQYLEGDIVLTVDQAETLLTDSITSSKRRRRRKRKLAEPVSKRWTLPIPYMFDGSHDATERKRIRDALAYWQDLTCITFKEDPAAEFKLLFVKQKGCWSYVGFTRQPNQTISIGDGCQSNGTIAHEIGHAVGFWHEQSRPDRDTYIIIHEDNITDGKLYNFQSRTWGEVVILNIPYDLGSGMHYGAKFYAKDVNGTLTTMQTRDPFMMRVIGQRQELSFYDVKLANMAYCSNTCSSYGIRINQPCKREGYQDPKNCRKCRCPSGFGGNYCEQVEPGVNAYCRGVLDASNRHNGTIYSPGYPSPGYRPDVQCNWLIKTNEHAHVYLEFVDDFAITCHDDVCKDFVEVRYNTSLAMTGARFCCTDPPRHPLRSDSNEMLVLFRTFSESAVCDDTKFPWKCKQYSLGFKAKYYSKPCGGCSSTTASGVFPVCLRRVSYACDQVWEERVKIECPRWWQSDSCGTRTVNRLRRVMCYRDQPYCCEPFQMDGNQCVGNAIIDLPNAVKRPGASLTNFNDKFYATKSVITTTTSTAIPTPTATRMAMTTTSVTTTTRPGSGTWTQWSEWGNCSRLCGGGSSVRTRTCVVPNTCGSTNIQVDKRPCALVACFDKCQVKKQILCDLWTTCTKTVPEKCNPRCYDGFTLYDNKCVQTGVT